MENFDTRSISIYFTYAQKDKLIRTSVALECSPAALIRLALKELLEKGEDHIRDGIDVEDFAINEAIKKSKEDRIK